MNLSRLSGRKVCERVKTKGMLWKGKHMQARIIFGLPRNLPESTPPCLLVGILTSTRLDKSAVKRNRMRRRCREALRISLKDACMGEKSREAAGLAGPAAGALQMRKGGSKGGTPVVALPRIAQLLILPRSSSLSAPFGEILADAALLLSFLSARG